MSNLNLQRSWYGLSHVRKAAVAVLLAILVIAVARMSFSKDEAPPTPSGPAQAAAETPAADSPKPRKMEGRFSASRDYPYVSLVRLIANPERYHNQRIGVRGYLHVFFEGTAIYLSRDDANHLIRANGIRVSFDKAKVPFEGPHGPVRYANQYVMLTGTFDTEHPDWYQGRLRGVDSVMVLPDITQPTESESSEPSSCDAGASSHAEP